MPATAVVSYTSVALLYVRLPDLGSVTTLKSEHLATFAGDTESEINAAIARKYALPLAGDVPILTTLATELTVYKVLSQRVFTAERLAASPWPDRYREAMAKLDKIAEGELLLVTTSGAVLAGRSDIAEVWSTTKDYHPTFWEGPQGTHVVDRDKIEDGANDRDLGLLRDRLL